MSYQIYDLIVQQSRNHTRHNSNFKNREQNNRMTEKKNLTKKKIKGQMKKTYIYYAVGYIISPLLTIKEKGPTNEDTIS